MPLQPPPLYRLEPDHQLVRDLQIYPYLREAFYGSNIPLEIVHLIAEYELNLVDLAVYHERKCEWNYRKSFAIYRRVIGEEDESVVACHGTPMSNYTNDEVAQAYYKIGWFYENGLHTVFVKLLCIVLKRTKWETWMRHTH